MDRDKLAKLIDKFLIDNEDGYYCEQFADYLISNGIGDITAEKHRADVAEEALRNGAVGEDLYCSSDDERHRLYLHLIREAEERLKEAEKNEQRAKKM